MARKRNFRNFKISPYEFSKTRINPYWDFTMLVVQENNILIPEPSRKLANAQTVLQASFHSFLFSKLLCNVLENS